MNMTPSTTLPSVALVIPVFNEEAVLPELFTRLNALFAIASSPCAWRAILVDDGSHDRSAALIRAQATLDPRWELVELSRTFGCQAALAAGRSHADATPADAGGTLEADLATLIAEIFTEVIIAPRFTAEALAIFAKKKNLRLMIAKAGMGAEALQEIRSVIGGVLVQDRDRTLGNVREFKVVTQRQPTAEEWSAMLFGWKVGKHVKSNSIVYCRGEQTLGVGAGQMARVDSSRIAVWKAGEAGLDLRGSVVASEALFPVADGLIAAAEAGATCAIQPGGSVRDAEVIAAADARGIAMVFTGSRHFKH